VAAWLDETAGTGVEAVIGAEDRSLAAEQAAAINSIPALASHRGPLVADAAVFNVEPPIGFTRTPVAMSPPHPTIPG